MFWCESIGSYALALDGEKRQCAVRSSNAGQCLYSGIAREAHASAVAEQLNSEGFFTGWGIRTIAGTEVRYNPMSYHNGSVWPHDNALIAAGFARYRLTQLAAKILGGFFEASALFDLNRLPELFCGFPGAPVRVRRCIRWLVHRKRGRRERLFCCCSRPLGSRSTLPRTALS